MRPPEWRPKRRRWRGGCGRKRWLGARGGRNFSVVSEEKGLLTPALSQHRYATYFCVVACSPLVASAAACRRADSTPPEPHTLVDSRDWYDLRSLDPARATDVPTGRAVAYLFDGLTRFTPDGRVEPGLARAWETSADGLQYTFHLRQGATFHDGKAICCRPGGELVHPRVVAGDQSRLGLAALPDQGRARVRRWQRHDPRAASSPR